MTSIHLITISITVLRISRDIHNTTISLLLIKTFNNRNIRSVVDGVFRPLYTLDVHLHQCIIAWHPIALLARVRRWV